MQRGSLFAAVLLLAMALRAPAADVAFRIKDYVGKAWGPSVVTYRVHFDSPALEKQLSLTDAAGVSLPFQLSAARMRRGAIADAEVSFLAAVPANATAVYTFHTGAPVKPATGTTPVTVRQDAKSLEFDNGHVRLRLPPPGSMACKDPIAASRVPGPIQGVQLADGAWVGKSELTTDRPITRYSCELLAVGPVYAEARIEYRFVPKGYYRVDVRLEQDAPLAVVSEEFDFGEFTEGRDVMALDLVGWQPEALCWRAASPFKQNDAFKQRMQEVSARGWHDAPYGETSYGYYEMPLGAAAIWAGEYVHPWRAWGVTEPVPPAENWLYMLPWMDWGPSAEYIGVNCGAMAPNGMNLQVGILALHTGSWRRPSNAMPRFRAARDGTAKIELPISCFGVMRPFNPFDSAEEYPSVPPTLGRRVWGLVPASKPRAT